MLIVFWATTLLLTVSALFFVLPWIKSLKGRLLLTVVFICSVYSLYFHWGSSQYLGQYYSKDAVATRTQRLVLQKLFSDFTKEEYRLRITLQDNPKDTEAEWRLMDVLAIKALYHGNPALAVEYWEAAIKKMPAALKPEFKQKILEVTQRQKH